MFEDWKNVVGDKVVFCPLCRHEADCTQWNIPEQLEYHRSLAIAHVQRTIGTALQRDARRLNSRQQKNGFVNITMSYRPNRLPVAIPASATAVMTQEFQCVEYKCRYSSIGIAYFCLACSYNNIFDAFCKSIETMSKLLKLSQLCAKLLPISKMKMLRRIQLGKFWKMACAKLLRISRNLQNRAFPDCLIPGSLLYAAMFSSGLKNQISFGKLRLLKDTLRY